jgi:hypothetical protein
MDLTGEVSCAEPYEWIETPWSIESGYGQVQSPNRHVVCVDYGAKRNILRCLAGLGCRITVVPVRTSAASILALRPNGIFLANGPGDPSATSVFAVPVIRELLASGVPTFGIFLGHQLFALALGARTVKMHLGHRGGNHPVQELASGRVQITSQNHGFVVVDLIDQGAVQLLIDTSLMVDELPGGRLLRTRAVQRRVPYCSRLSIVRAMVNAIECQQQWTPSLRPLQSYSEPRQRLRLFIRQPLTQSGDESKKIVEGVLQIVDEMDGNCVSIEYLTGNTPLSDEIFRENFEQSQRLPFNLVKFPPVPIEPAPPR